MSSTSKKYGYPNVPKSITNPNVLDVDTIDKHSPLSFLQFKNILSTSFEPITLKEFYSEYLSRWNSAKISLDENVSDFKINKYTEFLKSLVISGLSKSELKLLKNLDYNDPYDLETFSGIFVKKLKEISLSYNKRRNALKYNTTKKRLVGTTTGLTKSIYELVIGYLENLENSHTLYDIEDIKTSLKIEIEELYDVYPYYLKQPPNELIYDYKDIDYGFNIFLKNNEQLISEYFPNIDDDLKSIKQIDELFDTKRSLTMSNMGTDVYFLSTGNTVSEYLSGKLFEATHPLYNLNNTNFPTSASTPKSELETFKERGFFRPTNTTVVTMDGDRSNFVINFENLEPNTLYTFADPKQMGETDVITYILNDNIFKKNWSSGVSRGQPISSPTATKTYGYTSRFNYIYKDIEDLYNVGVVKDLKKDIYNNTYALISDSLSSLDSVQIVPSTITQYGLLINGYSFYDALFSEGFSFDYFVEDLSTYNETKRTGLSSNTGGFSSNQPDLIITFGQFTNFNELAPFTDEELISSNIILDGGFLYGNSGPYPEAVSSDLSAFDSSTGDFYYTELIDSGISDTSPLTRAYLDPLVPQLSGNLSLDYRDNVYDSGGFLTNVSLDLYTPDLVFGFDNSYTQTVLCSSDQITNTFANQIVVKSNNSLSTRLLIDEIPYLELKYPSVVYQSLSSVVNFEISTDILVIETEKYLLIEKITFENGEYVNPNTPPIYIEIEDSPYNKISNRYRVDNSIFFVVMNAIPLSSSNLIYPTFYKFDEKTSTLTKTTLSSSIEPQLSSLDIWMESSRTPFLSYGDSKDVFNLTYILLDSNQLSYINNLTIESLSDPTVNDHVVVSPTSNSISNVFVTNTYDLDEFMSSQTPIISNSELIL